MKRRNKILLIILSILMILSIVPITASATEISGACGDGLTWNYDEATQVLTISGTGAMYDYKSNNRPWESYIEDIQTVVINDGATTIGDFAFYYCINLKSVTIPDGVSMITKSAFYACESLTSIKIPDSVTTVYDYAFRYCGLMSVTIPDSVTTIGWATFANCYDLTSIMVDSNNQYYSSDEYGVLFNKDKTTLIQYPVGNSRTSYTIPDSVTTIGDWAFGECQRITSVVISDNVTTIGLGAFYWCDNLTDVFYSGTEDQWKAISFGGENYAIHRATIHFNHHIHNYEVVVTPPTCTGQGYTTYTCECGDTYVDDYVDATGHADTNNDGYCDNCDEQLRDNNGFIGDIVGLIQRIIDFLRNLFGINK